MKLWLLQRVGYTDWDETSGMVVRAKTAERAREIGQEEDRSVDFEFSEGGYANRGTWTKAELSSCEELGQGPGAEGLILRDFRAG